MDKCSQRNTGKRKLSQIRPVWVEYWEIKDDLGIARYLGKKKKARKVWELTVKLTKTDKPWENNCNGGMLSQSLNIGSRTKNHRVNTSKKFESSYEPQGSLEVVINPGTLGMYNANFDISMGKHKRDLIIMGYSQSPCLKPH